MHKKDKFLAELRADARSLGLSFQLNKKRGKGSHVTVYVAEKFTVVPDGDLDPHTRRKIRKALGLGRAEGIRR